MENVSGTTSMEKKVEIDEQKLKEKRYKFRKASELAKKFKYVDYEDDFSYLLDEAKTLDHETREKKSKKRVKSCLDYHFTQKEEYEDVFEPWD